MDIDVFYPLVLCFCEELIEVVEGRVNSAVAAEAEEVEFLASTFHIVVASGDFLVLKELVLAAGDIDLDEVLVDHAACTEIHVADLGVAHLALRKAYILTAALELRVGIFRAKRIDMGLTLCVNCVAVVRATKAPTVQNH